MGWYDKKFSNQYEEARKTLKDKTYQEDWKKLVGSLTELMTDAGFNDGKAASLDDLRKKVTPDTKKALAKGSTAAATEGQAILNGVSTASAGGSALDADTRKKAGALKFLRHMYLLKKAGNHRVWVHSLPLDFGDWPHWALDSGTEIAVKTLLNSNNERFTKDDKKHLSAATLEALKYCQKTLITLGNAGGKKEGRAKTGATDMVKRWFSDASTTGPQLASNITTLTDGFKKITDTINRGQIVLTDFPTLRNATVASEIGLLSSEAFVWPLGGREKLDVVYIENEFFGKKNVLTGLTNWVRILIHELSHLIVGTTDVEPGPRYAWYGIGPGTNFPSAKAMTNAENWAFFACDCAGALSKSERTRALTVK